MNRFFTDTKYAISWGILGLLVVSILTSAFLLAKTGQVLDDDEEFPNSIMVTGYAEVVAVPDIATFSFSVVEASENVSSAQELATEKANNVIDFLAEQGIEENDIKTTSYNVYPKYEWIQPVCISEIGCPRGSNELVGYEVSQSIRVKVRDTQQAGDLLSGIGSFEVSNVSGLNFEVDDEESLKAEARSMAIDDAKEKAEKLAKDLGVDLDDIIGFSEDSGYSQPYERSYMESVSFDSMGGASASPKIPTGENTITKTVYINYEIK
jgi:uncharacterized protein YggE